MKQQNLKKNSTELKYQNPKNPKNPEPAKKIPETIDVKKPEMPLADISASEEPKIIKNKGGRPRKIIESQEPKPKPSKEDLRPGFETLSIILKSFHAEPLTPLEIETGLTAWLPVYEKYYPLIGEKAPFMFAIAWTVSIIAPRIKSFTKKPLEEQEKKE